MSTWAIPFEIKTLTCPDSHFSVMDFRAVGWLKKNSEMGE
jgi:hypothetical protein